MVWSGYAVLMSGKTDSIKLNKIPGYLPGSTFVYSEVFKLDFSSASPFIQYILRWSPSEKVGYAVSDGIGYAGLESVSIRCIQGIGYSVLEFLGVGIMFDIFTNIHLLYLQYGVLIFSGYGVLVLYPSWSLVSAGTDTPYLP
ncbi:hypothetical protein Tco_0571231 [Tanacetum coccineum]